MKEKKEPNVLDIILETYDEYDFVEAPGLEDAVVGVDANNYILIYDIEKCIEVIAENMDITEEDLDVFEKAQGMTLEEKKYELAKEHFYFNVFDAYVEVKDKDGNALPRPIFMDSQF